jgi:hypothetical protein
MLDISWPEGKTPLIARDVVAFVAVMGRCSSTRA